MPVPESVDSGSNPGLYSSLRSFWGVFIAILRTRLDLLTLELEEEAKRAIQLMLVSIATLLTASMGVFFLMFLLIASFWDTPYRLLILGIVCVVYFIITVVLFFVARQMILTRPRFLSQTLVELRRDVEGIRPATKSEEARP